MTTTFQPCARSCRETSAKRCLLRSIFFPEFDIALRKTWFFAVFVSVPETTVNENDCFEFFQYDIWFFEQILLTQAETKPQQKKQRPHFLFRLCVAGFDFCYNARSFRGWLYGNGLAVFRRVQKENHAQTAVAEVRLCQQSVFRFRPCQHRFGKDNQERRRCWTRTRPPCFKAVRAV